MHLNNLIVVHCLPLEIGYWAHTTQPHHRTPSEPVLSEACIYPYWARESAPVAPIVRQLHPQPHQESLVALCEFRTPVCPLYDQIVGDPEWKLVTCGVGNSKFGADLQLGQSNSVLAFAEGLPQGEVHDKGILTGPVLAPDRAPELQQSSQEGFGVSSQAHGGCLRLP